MLRKPKVILGVSGSIAAVKAPELVRLLVEKGMDVTCLLTHEAEKFVTPLSLSTFSGNRAFSGVFGSDAYQMPHLKLAAEADIMVVAPMTATLLGRFAHGLSEDIISLTYITTEAPVVVAPALHPTMWTHPATQENVRILKSRGVVFSGPTQGLLADKSTGLGRMSEPIEIVSLIQKLLKNKKH